MFYVLYTRFFPVRETDIVHCVLFVSLDIRLPRDLPVDGCRGRRAQDRGEGVEGGTVRGGVPGGEPRDLQHGEGGFRV